MQHYLKDIWKKYFLSIFIFVVIVLIIGLLFAQVGIVSLVLSPINNSAYTTSPIIINFSANVTRNSTNLGILNFSLFINDKLNQTIEHAWNLSSQYDLMDEFDVSSQELNPNGFFFKGDGTRMYIIGPNTDFVHQYSLSVAWDIDSASYDNVNFSVNSEDTSPQGVFFKDDGTKMYIIGRSLNLVHEYDLSDPWNVSSASYGSVNFDVGSQDSSPEGFFFRSDGIRMYVIGSSSDTVYQYSLSVAWDLSTASYSSISFNIASQDPNPEGVFFKDDGTKMYLMGGGAGDFVYRYNLSDPWNVSSASYDNVNFSVSDTIPTGVFFKNDGKEMYTIGETNDEVQRYHLFTAWDPSSASFIEGSIPSQDGNPNGFFFKGDGTKMYEIGNIGDLVYQYNLSDPWNVSSAVYENINISAIDSSAQDLFFKDGGTALYILGDSNETIYQSTCSDAWNISSCSYIYVNVSTQDTNPRGFFIGNNGTKLYEAGIAGDVIYQYTCSDAWNISSCSYDGVSISTADPSTQGLFFKDDGTKLYEIGTTNNQFYQSTCSDAWNISSCSYDGVSISTKSTNPRDLFIGDNGTKLYESGIDQDTIYQHSFYKDGDTLHNFSANFSSEGNHNWTVRVYDSGGFVYEEVFFFIIDIANPLISYGTGTPTDNANLTENYFFVNTSVIETNPKNITFRLYNRTSLVNETTYTNLITEINWTNLPEEIYQYNVTIFDLINNSNFTSTQTVEIDFGFPLVEFISPTESNDSVLGRDYISVNISVTDTNLDTLIVYLYNSTDLVQSNVSTSSEFFVNFTGLTADNYFINATSNDTLGNQNSTETRQISLLVPRLDLVKPKNETYFNGINISLDFLTSLNDFAWYNLDGGSNFTIVGNSTFNISSGQHTLNLFSNNTLGENTTSIVFTINESKFKVFYNKYSNQGNSSYFNGSSFEDVQNLSDVTLENPSFGRIKFNENLNLTNDSTPNDSQIDIDNYTNISFNRIEVNSTILPNFNKLATLSLYGLSFSNPRILKDGSICSSPECIEVSYSGGTFVFNVTGFSVYTSEETPTSPGGDSGSGSGGGGGSLAISDFIETDKEKINVKLIQGGIEETSVTIKNNASTKRLFELEVEGISELIKIGETSFDLASNESKTVDIDFIAKSDTLIDSYVGKLLIKSLGTVKEILISVDVRKGGALFDVKVEILRQFFEILPGGEIVADVKLFNFGNEGRVDAVIDYEVKNNNNEIILIEHETLAVETQTSFTKRLTLPLDMEYGEYILFVKATYANEVVSSSTRFYVGKKPLLGKILYWGLILFLISSILLVVTLIKKIGGGRGKAELKRLVKYVSS